MVLWFLHLCRLRGCLLSLCCVPSLVSLHSQLFIHFSSRTIIFFKVILLICFFILLFFFFIVLLLFLCLHVAIVSRHCLSPIVCERVVVLPHVSFLFSWVAIGFVGRWKGGLWLEFAFCSFARARGCICFFVVWHVAVLFAWDKKTQHLAGFWDKFRALGHWFGLGGNVGDHKRWSLEINVLKKATREPWSLEIMVQEKLGWNYDL